jgi:preprotein translocase subunit SecE
MKKDIPQWLLLFLVTFGVCALNYKITTMSTPIVSIVWILWLLVSLAIIYFTQLGQKGLAFFKDAKQELLKVVWPSRQETVQMTMVIMVVVFVISIILWGVDSSLLWLVGKLTSLK